MYGYYPCVEEYIKYQVTPWYSLKIYIAPQNSFQEWYNFFQTILNFINNIDVSDFHEWYEKQQKLKTAYDNKANREAIKEAAWKHHKRYVNFNKRDIYGLGRTIEGKSLKEYLLFNDLPKESRYVLNTDAVMFAFCVTSITVLTCIAIKTN